MWEAKNANQKHIVLSFVTLLPLVTLSTVVFSPVEELTVWNMVQEWLQTVSLALEGTTAPTLALLHLEHVVLATSQ